jgi:putative protease
MNKIELLAPAGNMECLIAAINNGADAVYLGGKKFGARAFSNNFNDEEMVEAIKLAHKNNVKVYVTVNTIIFNEEIEDVINYLKFLYCNHVDAVLMQDIGLINLTRKVLPNLEIHISTQAHNHNEEAIKYFKELGCTRVVFDRESTLEEIKSVNVDIEKEVFVYGALCISYSGNCLFSYLFNGRSANRGMCSQMCRMKYSL